MLDFLSENIPEAKKAKPEQFFDDLISQAIGRGQMNLRGSPAKAQKRQGEGPLPVIPSECEGSNQISPCGRNDKNSELCAFAPLREKYPNPKILKE